MIRDADLLKIAGQRYRQVREQKNLSRLAVAYEARVSPRTIENFESGQCAPNFLRINRLCSALGVTLYDLILSATDDGLGDIP